MSLTLTDAVADLIKTWDNCHSNDPISEIWDELVAVDKAWKLATTPAEINPGKTADLVGTPVEYPSSPAKALFDYWIAWKDKIILLVRDYECTTGMQVKLSRLMEEMAPDTKRDEESGKP